MPPTVPADRDDRVLPYTRVLSLCIVPFLLAGFVILYFFPGHTDRLWAWPMKPPMSAMVLASAYLGGAYFFVQVQRERRWHVIGPGFPTVALFAGLLGIATLLDWDVFSHGNAAFWIWAGLYFLAPFLVLGGWLANRRYSAPPGRDDDRLAPASRAAILVIGLGALGWGIVMFADPAAFVDLWPWALTPLSARVMAAVWCLGSAGLSVWTDTRWSRVRLMLEVDVVMLGLMLVAAAREHDELDASKPLAWPLLIGTIAILTGSIVLWVRHELRPRGVGPPEVRPAAGG